jgi:hypothetical protein
MQSCWHINIATLANKHSMGKKLLFLVAICFFAASCSHHMYDDKAGKKNGKMLKRSTARENAGKADNGGAAAKEMEKMNKKEERINKKAAQGK